MVWVKPNIGWDRTPEQAANTNPDVVAALVRLCFEAGAKTVKVGDNTCNRAGKTYQNSGVAAAAQERGRRSGLPRSQPLPRNRHPRRTHQDASPSIPRILDCDLVINVPIVKHHLLTEKHHVHEELHGRDRESASLSTRTFPPAWPISRDS